MQSFIWKKVSQEGVDPGKTTLLANKYMTSHFKGYAHALYEQEVNTKDPQYCRDKKADLPPKQNKKISTLHSEC